MTLLGIEIGATKLQLVLGDERGRITLRRRVAVERARGGEGIREQIAAVFGEWRGAHAWRAVGVGYGGPVDWRTGHIRCSHQVAGWKNFPLGDWLRDLTGVPVSVDNDSNVAALGEALRGAGAGAGLSPVFYTNSGSGVGGGLVVDGRLYHGAPPGEAEFGHLRLDQTGTIVEDRCSGWAVDRKVHDVARARPDGVLGKLCAGQHGGEARHLAAALAQGDPDATAILHSTARDHAFALSHVAHLFHPAVIVLGGGLALLGDPWRAAVAEELPRFVMEAFHPVPPVKLAALGEDVVPVGALALAASALGAENSL
jgi:glucokinase